MGERVAKAAGVLLCETQALLLCFMQMAPLGLWGVADAYHRPGAVLSALQILTHSVLPATLRGNYPPW